MRKVSTLLLMTVLISFVIGFALMEGASGGGDPHRAFAGVGPTATPKPGADGSLSGVYDVLVHPDDKSVGIFHCIARLDHDAGDDAVKGATICYADAPGLTSGGAVPDRADGIPGPPPPPPYTTAVPTKLHGSYDPGTDVLSLAGCFANVGGSLGPNYIVELEVAGAKAALPDLEGSVLIHGKQSIAQCETLSPGGPGDPQSVNLTQADASRDFDGDGCTDSQELSKPAPDGTCGNDPYNPYDSDGAFSSVGSLLITVTQADVCQDGEPRGDQPQPVGCQDAPDGAIAAGSYFHCVTDTTHNADTNALTVRLMCYTDDPLLTVNCQEVQGAPAKAICSTFASACPPLGPQPASRCGDGLPGARPPTPFGDVDSTHPVLTGTYDKTTNQLQFEGCFQGVENPLEGPNVYWRAAVEAQTGQGTVDIWTLRANCTKPVTTPTFDDALIELVEQQCTSGPSPAPGADCVSSGPDAWDTDLDYCPDRVELGPNPNLGGLRDPLNRWDFFDHYTGFPNPAKDGAITGGDISAHIARFGATGDPTGDPKSTPTSPTGYHTSIDRGGALAGSNAWNLRPPDGSQTGGDISAVVAQFGHTGCNGS